MVARHNFLGSENTNSGQHMPIIFWPCASLCMVNMHHCTRYICSMYKVHMYMVKMHHAAGAAAGVAAGAAAGAADGATARVAARIAARPDAGAAAAAAGLYRPCARHVFDN